MNNLNGSTPHIATHTPQVSPNSLDAEQSTLGAMLMDADAIGEAAQMLNAADFYREMHRRLFAAMLTMYERGEEVDMITLTGELSRREELEECGGPAYLQALIESCPSAANVESYARIVNEHSVRRALIRTASKISNWAYGEIDSVPELLDRAERQVLRVGERRVADVPEALGSALGEECERLLRVARNPGLATGIPTGFPDLDNLLGGLQPSDLVILAARPSMGKSGLAMQLALNAATIGQKINKAAPVLFFSLEMSKGQLMQRVICSEAHVESGGLRRGISGDMEWQRIHAVRRKLQSTPLFVVDTPQLSIFEMRAQARRVASQSGALGLIVVDYLQLASSGDKRENEMQEVSEISRSLKALARDMKCPVLALSQLSRAVESREDKRPMLSDLRSSGAIEQDADVVMFLYRAAYYQRKGATKDNWGAALPQDDTAEVIVAKHRNGPVGTVNLAFIAEWARFESLARSEVPV